MFKLKHQGVLIKMSSRFGQAEENDDSSIMTQLGLLARRSDVF